jgi:hypothetical protein
MRHRTAVFLAFYSERTFGGSPGYPLARVAWRALAAAAAQGDRTAIEAVWQAWLRNPDDERWDLLSECRGARELAGAVFAAATDPARPAGSRAALGAFCASHGLAPAPGAERALFYLLTGQPAQHRADDPTGEALRTAYQAADEPVRAALRQAMTESGDLDLVRVVAAQREPDRPVTDAERRYLAGELARRRDWPALWRLARGLPLAGTIAAVRLIDPGWRPPDEPGRELLARLVAGAGLDTARQGKPALTTVRLETPGTRVLAGSFSPDERRFAAVVYSPVPPTRRVCEFELPRGTMVAQYDYDLDRTPLGLLYLGGAIVVAGRRGSQVGGRDFLDRFAGDSPDVLAEFPAAMCGLAPYADGFVLLRQGWMTRRDAGGEYWDIQTRDGRGELLFCDPHGQTLRRVSVSASDYQHHLEQVIVDPDSGRLVVLGYGVELYAPLGEQLIARSWSSVGRVCFLGPGRFAVARYGTLQMWHLLGSRLVRQPMRRRVPRDQGAAHIVAVPRRGELAVLIRKKAEEPGFVRYFDAQTLTAIKGQQGLAGKTGHELWSSPRGGAHALAGDGGGIDIAFATHPLAPLLGQPMEDMTSGDLAAMAGSLGRHDQFPAERPALELLRACLEYRFGSDVAIGDAPAPDPGTDDIALSAEP